jgi:hypothetical protein
VKELSDYLADKELTPEGFDYPDGFYGTFITGNYNDLILKPSTPARTPAISSSIEDAPKLGATYGCDEKRVATVERHVYHHAASSRGTSDTFAEKERSDGGRAAKEISARRTAEWAGGA